MDSPEKPQAPDPVATANAQAAMNTKTAITQAGLNNVNQVTPDGSLTYTQGTWENGDPRFTATTALSPASQSIYDTNQVTKQNIADIGRDQSARIGGILGTPLKLGNDATEARLMDLGMKRLDPRFAQDEEALRTRLANSGVREGSQAFKDAYGNLKNSQNDAVTSLILAGRGQANQELMAERNSPINEITALMSGSQVSNPSFVSTPQTQVAGTNYAGMVQNNYDNATKQYATDMSQNNAAMGGMFGTAGSLGAASVMKYGLPFLSDRRAKDDIRRVGGLDNGLPVYVFRYKGEDGMQIGLMADEVEKVHPEAVMTGSHGYKMVDYSRAVRA
jgi:hypothetical protein